MSSNLMTNFVTTFSRTTKENIKGLYKHPATIRHKGTVLAFVMDDERRIWYSVLALDEALKKSEENQGTNESKPTLDLDKDHWTDPAELFFPTEISKVGFGVADQTRLPVFAKDVPTPQPVGTILPSRASEIRPFEPDYFHSTTARFTADTAFQVLSDGKYVYLFRQAIDEDHRDMLFIDPDGKFYSDKNDEAVTKDTGNPLVNGHLLVDRYLLLGTQLRSVREVRYQRSRSKTRPASRKDGLDAQDLDGNAFYEPTQQLRFVRSIKDGHFTVLLLPTAVAEVERWQIFTHNSKTGLIDTYNVERSADGWFNTRGTQVYTCVDSDETNTRKTGEHGKVYLGKPGKCVEPSLADPSRSCGKDLIKRTITEGYAESALNFKNGDAYIELTGGGIALTQGSASLRHLFSVDSQLADKSKRKEFTDALNKGFLSLERQLSAKFTIKEEGLAAKRLEITDSGKEYLLILEDQRLNVYSVEARFTLEAWIYPEDSGSSIQTLITGHGEIDDSLSASRSDPKTCPSLWIVDHRRLQIGFGDGTSWNEYTTDSLLKPGAWNHIAVTFDGVAFRIFVDGALRAKSETADIYENGVKIHAWNDKEITGSNGNTPLPNLLSDKSPSGSAITFFGSKSNSFTGQIDEIRIWKRARTKDELFADRHQRLTGFEPGLAGYWRFDEYRGDTVYDQTDQNAYGTIHGGYKWTASQAPVGQNPGVNRNSFRVEGRSVASGLTALLYYQQEPVASGYSGEEKPLKQKGRVMLAMATQAEAGPTESDKPYIAVLDFAVSQEGRLAQIPDVVSLEPVNKTGQDEQSMNDLLDEISAAENRWAELSDKEKDVNKKNRDKFNNSVQTEPMRLVHVDPFGLTTSGALLDFAWSKDTPQLFDSATGKLALYFRGVANQFFVTYYDTLTERATYPLTDKTNPLTDKTNETVLCKARSAELEMDKIVIEIGGEDENTCTVEVSGAGMQETWRRVPRDAKEFAAVLNGERNKRSFIGRGRLKFKYGVAIGLAMESDLEKVEPGDVLMVGGARVVVERKDKSYFEISSDETNLTNERLPVFKLP
ncbi:MAG TPA: LamG domain-containing protein, partial [Anaerolineales bacterium]|nr:LamG domain-containing protein [Anaerolineales bacterium]